MTFREELQASILEERLANIEEDIKRAGDRGYLKIPIREGVDVASGWFGRYKLLPPGQAIWDKLVSLGFKPQYTSGGEWCIDGIYITW